MTSIPASQIVNVIPGVLGTGGNPLSLNAVFLTPDTSIPIGTVKSFASYDDVAAWFGAGSNEAALAQVYFNGFIGCTALPSALLFAQYNTANVAGYLRGSTFGVNAPLSSITSLSGTIAISIDGGAVLTSANINLATATSFTNAAALITTGFTSATTPIPATCTWDAQRNAFVITSNTTGASSSVAFPTVDSIVTGLKLSAATGAVQSPGAVAAVEATLMNGIVAQTQNWATFMCVAEPTLTKKLAFAVWVNGQNDRYMYVANDSSTLAYDTANDSFGYQVKAAAYDGVFPLYDPLTAVTNTLSQANASLKAAFVCGTTASINFNETNGRITFDFKGQSGLAADVVDATTAANLTANGYNFYAAYATANQQFVFLQPGQVPGRWLWADPYVNQIWLNSNFQLALMTLLTNVKSIPYTTQGYGLVRAALRDTIDAALNAGVIRSGVSLSSSQAAQVNAAAGVSISDALQNTGWYLQVKDPGALVRGQRGTPNMTFWYTDGGSIQKLTLASIDIE
jgi:hypothetical protein